MNCATAVVGTSIAVSFYIPFIFRAIGNASCKQDINTYTFDLFHFTTKKVVLREKMKALNAKQNIMQNYDPQNISGISYQKNSAIFQSEQSANSSFSMSDISSIDFVDIRKKISEMHENSIVLSDVQSAISRIDIDSLEYIPEEEDDELQVIELPQIQLQSVNANNSEILSMSFVSLHSNSTQSLLRNISSSSLNSNSSNRRRSSSKLDWDSVFKRNILEYEYISDIDRDSSLMWEQNDIDGDLELHTLEIVCGHVFYRLEKLFRNYSNDGQFMNKLSFRYLIEDYLKAAKVWVPRYIYSVSMIKMKYTLLDIPSFVTYHLS